MPRFELPAKALALIAASERVRQQVADFDGMWIQVDGRIGNGLGNSGDELTLLDSANQVIDAVSWGTSSTILDPSIKAVAAGETLKRQLPRDTDTAADWEPKPQTNEEEADRRAGAAGNPAPSAGAAPHAGAKTAPNASASAPSQSASSGTARVIFSEIEPNHAWLELYNPQTHFQLLDGWQLDDDDPETPPFVFPPETTLDAHGFLVVEAADLKQLHGSILRLLRPDGSFADMLSYTPTKAGTTLSRYPVQGGGWQLNTPPTRGTFNQAPPPRVTPTPTRQPIASARPVAPRAERASKSEQPASIMPRPDWFKRLLAPLLALSLIAGAVVWSRWSQSRAGTIDALAGESRQDTALSPANHTDEQDEEPM